MLMSKSYVNNFQSCILLLCIGISATLCFLKASGYFYLKSSCYFYT